MRVIKWPACENMNDGMLKAILFNTIFFFSPPPYLIKESSSWRVNTRTFRTSRSISCQRCDLSSRTIPTNERHVRMTIGSNLVLGSCATSRFFPHVHGAFARRFSTAVSNIKHYEGEHNRPYLSTVLNLTKQAPIMKMISRSTFSSGHSPWSAAALTDPACSSILSRWSAWYLFNISSNSRDHDLSLPFFFFFFFPFFFFSFRSNSRVKRK